MVFLHETSKPMPPGRRGPGGGIVVATAWAATAFVVVDAVAALLAPQLVRATLFTVPLLLIVPVAWTVFTRAPLGQRRAWALLAAAGTLWVAASLYWYGAYVSNQRPPPSPGPWDAMLVVAYGIGLAGAVAAVRGVVSLRNAALDASIAIAVGAAIGALALGRHDVSKPALLILSLPVLGAAMVILFATAALAAPSGVPLSVALIGAGQGLLAAGSFRYSLTSLAGRASGDRWADVSWTAAVVVLLAAGVVTLAGRDRFVRLSLLPAAARSACGVLYGAAAALAVTAGVGGYGLGTGDDRLAAVGLVTTLAVAGATAVRAVRALRAAERAYAVLDEAHVAGERNRDELACANDELARVNVELRYVHEAFGDLLSLADERTHGALREQIEATGADIARLLERYLNRRG